MTRGTVLLEGPIWGVFIMSEVPKVNCLAMVLLKGPGGGAVFHERGTPTGAPLIAA